MPRKRHKNKRYSPELKIAVVEAYLSGKGSMAELAKKYPQAPQSGTQQDRDRVKLPVRSEHCGGNAAAGSELRSAMAAAGGNVG